MDNYCFSNSKNDVDWTEMMMSKMLPVEWDLPASLFPAASPTPTSKYTKGLGTLGYDVGYGLGAGTAGRGEVGGNRRLLIA